MVGSNLASLRPAHPEHGSRGQANDSLAPNRRPSPFIGSTDQEEPRAAALWIVQKRCNSGAPPAEDIGVPWCACKAFPHETPFAAGAAASNEPPRVTRQAFSRGTHDLSSTAHHRPRGRQGHADEIVHT